MNKYQPALDDQGALTLKSYKPDENYFPDPSWISWLRMQMPVMQITQQLAEVTFDFEFSPNDRVEYEYMEVGVEGSKAETANHWAKQGWRLVAVSPVTTPGRGVLAAYNFLLERRK